MASNEFDDWFDKLERAHTRGITPMERVFALEAWNYQQNVIRKQTSLLKEFCLEKCRTCEDYSICCEIGKCGDYSDDCYKS